MPSITTIHESLPYIDPPPSPPSLAAATHLITTEASTTSPSGPDPHHALLPPPYTPRFLTPILAPLLSGPSPPTPLSALDLTRYEAPSTDPLAPAASLPSALSRAYTSHAYVSSRRAHLALLDAYGKNAWLVGNWYLEGELKAVERELAEARREIDLLTLARQGAQEAAGPEMKGLEEGWRRGVARVLEAEAAAEGLRREVLEGVRRRAAEEEGK
ncbi:Pre-mRNA-splicing factor SPF27 [Podospora conica]|nr:Pre-mRNA-splicing factor SPF27 [Schizothecium conicum]